MFSDFSVFNFLIYAAGIGFGVAIIYTNIQRTALSKFINYLADNNCTNDTSAVTLDDIGLSGVQKKIILSAVKHQYGFKKSVAVISDSISSESEDESFFDKKDNSKYFLSDSNIEELKKKYTFKTMSTKLVVLFLVALAVVVFFASSLAAWLIDSVSTPKSYEQSNDTKIEEQQNKEQLTDEQEDNSDISDTPLIDNFDDNTSNEETAGPRIPI